jgi:thiol-disulfide isomerase/thioredoxin
MNKKQISILAIVLTLGLGLFLFTQTAGNNKDTNNEITPLERAVTENQKEKEDTTTQIEEEKPSVKGETVAENEEASEESVVVYFFWGEGCPHCAVEKPFLEEMEQKYPQLEVKMYETWKNKENMEAFEQMAEAYGIQARGVPTTFIGDYDPIIGFSESMADDMESKIISCVEDGCINPASKL